MNAMHFVPKSGGSRIFWILLLSLALTGGVAGLSSAGTFDFDEKAKIHYQEGVRLSQNHQWKKAIEAFEKAVKLDPLHALAQANLGVAYSHLKLYKEALLAFDKALKLGYDHAGLRYNRGVSFAQVKLLEEAARELETALKMNPRMVKADYDLGVVYNLMGKNQKAREQVNKLYRRNYPLAKKLHEQIPPPYTVISVDDGGTLKGRVTLQGPIPKPRSFHLIHSPNIEFCSRISDGKGHRLLFDFSVSETRGLKDTIIAIKGIKKGKPFPPKMQKFHISRCHSDQYVIGIQNSENILIENTDPIRHEIATYESAGSYVRQTSNRAVVAKSSQVRNAFVRKDVDEFIIKCNLHPFLQTRGYMVSNPYYAITDEEGNFVIPDIPPGTYEVVAWHPFIPTQKGEITIRAGEETEIQFQFDGQEERRKLYQDDLIGYRFQPWYDSHKKFYGGPREDDPVEVLQKF